MNKKDDNQVTSCGGYIRSLINHQAFQTEKKNPNEFALRGKEYSSSRNIKEGESLDQSLRFFFFFF